MAAVSADDGQTEAAARGVDAVFPPSARRLTQLSDRRDLPGSRCQAPGPATRALGVDPRDTNVGADTSAPPHVLPHAMSERLNRQTLARDWPHLAAPARWVRPDGRGGPSPE